jgi:hypothetical protein
MITEGGVTLANVRSRYGLTDAAAVQRKQGELLQRNWNRMAPSTGEGAGIAMVCQYLLHTDPNFDSGLCETPETGGAVRSAYATWKALPSNV